MFETGQMTDEEMLRTAWESREDISELLLEKYKGLVIQKARSLYLIGGEQDDLIQEGMIGLYKAVRDYRESRNCSFLTFASLCIDRQMYSAIENSRRKKHIPLNSYVSLSEEADQEFFELFSENPESMIIREEDYLSLEKEIIQRLSPLENQVLERYLKGIGYLKIAEELDKTPKSIDNAIQRIRQKIRELIVEKKSENV